MDRPRLEPRRQEFIEVAGRYATSPNCWNLRELRRAADRLYDATSFDEDEATPSELALEDTEG
jgi:hypothetical protein